MKEFYEPVAQIVSSGEHEFPVLQWLSANHSFMLPIGTKLGKYPAESDELLRLIEPYIVLSEALGDPVDLGGRIRAYLARAK